MASNINLETAIILLNKSALKGGSQTQIFKRKQMKRSHLYIGLNI